MSITGEIRHGTIRPTFLATPNRARVIAAKVAASALAGVALGLLAEALTAAIESAGLAVRGIHIALSAGDYAQLLAGGGAAAALWAAIGVGVGALVRNQSSEANRAPMLVPAEHLQLAVAGDQLAACL
jgi:hypothetical protein